MVAGGSSTYAWDISAGLRSRLIRKWRVIVRREAAESDRLAINSISGVEAPTRSTLVSAVGLTARPVMIKEREVNSPVVGVDTLRIASTPRDTPEAAHLTSVISQPSGDNDEANLVPSLYFKLSVRGGLILCGFLAMPASTFEPC